LGMKKVLFPFIAVVLAIAACLYGYHWWRSAHRPNVVVILIDTLRADKLGSYGSPAGASPDLDALAAGGVRFADVIAQSSWTRPSIGSILTSRYPRSLGIEKEQWDIMPDDVETAAKIFHRAGYYTIGATANPNLYKVFNFQGG